MSAVLRLYTGRQRGPTTLVLPTSDGDLTIVWPLRVDPHELAKAQACGSARKPWRDVLDAVSDAVDCAGAEVKAP